jgi:hypothetical protein
LTDAADYGIEIVREPIPRPHLQRLAEDLFGDLVKAVVDVERGIMAVGGELHADEEAVLLDDGGRQADCGESISIRSRSGSATSSSLTR